MPNKLPEDQKRTNKAFCINLQDEAYIKGFSKKQSRSEGIRNIIQFINAMFAEGKFTKEDVTKFMGR